MPEKTGHFYEFGGFRLDAENHALWLGDRLVAIAPKALELLILLIRRHGNIVSREELLETIWRDTFVEEANINYTVSQLRKILSENSQSDAPFVQTVPKQGYRFVAGLKEVFETDRKSAKFTNLPAADSLPAVSKSPVRWYFSAIILVGVLFLTSFAYWWKVNDQKGLSSLPGSERNIRTLAILPLKMLSEGEKNKTLSLGLTDSLISRLGSLNRFAVRPMSSVKDYIKSDQDPLKFGTKLKVDAVLEGTLQQTDNRLRVNLRLWDVRDGARMWQDSFDSTEADIFNLQDAISTKVTQSLVSELLEKDREILTRRDTDNPEAFRAYIRGRAIMDSKNPDSAEKAIDEYQKAAVLDPTFAMAYVGYADAFSRLGFTSSGAKADEYYAKSKAAANKALALDPKLAEAYAALASVKRIYDWDWNGAENDFKRAIELNPNYSKAHLWYALLLSSLGRNEEALAEIKRAIAIDPLSPDIKAGHFSVLEGRREYAEALALARENVKFNKESGLGRRALATFSFHQGEYAQVIEISEQELPKKNSQRFVWLSLLANAYTKSIRPKRRTKISNNSKNYRKPTPKRFIR